MLIDVLSSPGKKSDTLESLEMNISENNIDYALETSGNYIGVGQNRRPRGPQMLV